MNTEIDAADWLTLSSAWRSEQGLLANREIASAKLYASEMLARVTDTTLQIFGRMGLMDDLPIERFLGSNQPFEPLLAKSNSILVHLQLVIDCHKAWARHALHFSIFRKFYALLLDLGQKH